MGLSLGFSGTPHPHRRSSCGLRCALRVSRSSRRARVKQYVGLDVSQKDRQGGEGEPWLARMVAGLADVTTDLRGGDRAN
jgi:hypothetical protein